MCFFVNFVLASVCVNFLAAEPPKLGHQQLKHSNLKELHTRSVGLKMLSIWMVRGQGQLCGFCGAFSCWNAKKVHLIMLATGQSISCAGATSVGITNWKVSHLGFNWHYGQKKSRIHNILILFDSWLCFWTSALEDHQLQPCEWPLGGHGRIE